MNARALTITDIAARSSTARPHGSDGGERTPDGLRGAPLEERLAGCGAADVPRQPVRTAVSFIDQYVQLRNAEGAGHLHGLLPSMEASPGTTEVALPAGDPVVLNHLFCLRGHAPFVKVDGLHREVMRQRGTSAC